MGSGYTENEVSHSVLRPGTLPTAWSASMASMPAIDTCITPPYEAGSRVEMIGKVSGMHKRPSQQYIKSSEDISRSHCRQACFILPYMAYATSVHFTEA